jgi:prolyl 4-hydroxylase
MTDFSSQEPTPAVLQWVKSQRAAGFDALALYKSLRDSGWAHDMACRLADLQPAQAPEQASTSSPATEPAEPAVPWPTGAGQRVALDAGDRHVQALAVMREPNIVVLAHVLSDEECDALVAAALPRLSRSLTVSVKTGGEEENVDRTSQGMFFARGESETIARIEARLAHLLNWPMENGEGLQILRYGPGAEYKPHYDYFDPHEPGTPRILERGGQRVATVVIYLNEPEAGGGTVFPDVQFECMPRKGHAVFFNYSRPHPDSRSLHGGSPVISGEKWIATKWLREHRFD